MRFCSPPSITLTWTFSKTTYSYDNAPAQEICYTVAREKEKAVMACGCFGITIYHFTVSFPKGEKQYFFFQVMSVKACAV